MATQIVGVYQIGASGPLTVTALSTSLAAAPIDFALLSRNGLRLVSDATLITGPNAARTLTFGMDAVTPATATVTLVAGGGSSLAAAAPGVVGAGYVRPPVLTVVPAVGGSGPTSGKNVAELKPNLGVVAPGAILLGGTGYSPGSQVLASGGELAPGGVQATFTPTISGLGAFTGIALATAGGPYNVPPTLAAFDPLGLGAGASFGPASLGMTSVSLLKPGLGYVGTPTVLVTPYFKSLWPDAAGLAVQASSIGNFMSAIISLFTSSPVSAATTAS
jgi:hypothetical protein